MHSNPEVLRVVAKHHQTPLSALEMMARCKDYNLGMIIAERQDVTEQILLILAEHGTIAVRLYLAQYHKYPSSILETLAESLNQIGLFGNIFIINLLKSQALL